MLNSYGLALNPVERKNEEGKTNFQNLSKIRQASFTAYIFAMKQMPREEESLFVCLN